MPSSRRHFTRMTCLLAMFFSGCLLFGQSTAPAKKPSAPKTAPAAKPKRLPKEKAHVQHVTNGKCADQTTHGNPRLFENVVCPDSCKSASGPQDYVVEIDPYVKSQQENDAVCLRAGDTVAWHSKSGLNFKIKDITSNGRQGHPFMGKVQPKSYDSKPDGSGSKTDQQKVRNSAIPDNGCFLFHPKVEVDDGSGGIKCYDPHIYTDCFDTCDVSLEARVKAPKPGTSVARKAKPAGQQAEVPSSR